MAGCQTSWILGEDGLDHWTTSSPISPSVCILLGGGNSCQFMVSNVLGGEGQRVEIPRPSGRSAKHQCSKSHKVIKMSVKLATKKKMLR